MDTNVFRYCLEVEESKNITLAAKHLFISQPALSKQLNKLEKELGFQIFDRARSPITVTPQGELFLEFAHRYVDMERELLESLRQFSPVQTEPVRIATTHRGGTYAGSQAASFMLEPARRYSNPEDHRAAGLCRPQNCRIKQKSPGGCRGSLSLSCICWQRRHATPRIFLVLFRTSAGSRPELFTLPAISCASTSAGSGSGGFAATPWMVQ